MLFRPEVWADEFAMYFAEQRSLLDLVSRFDNLAQTQGQGETIKIPALELDAAKPIVPGADAVAAVVTDGTVDLVLNQFRGHLIQVKPQDERFNHKDWRQAILKEQARKQKMDTDTALAAVATDALVTQEVNAGGGVWTDALVLEAQQKLDDAEFPTEGRILLASPAAYNDLAQITTFISKDFGDGQGQRKVAYVRDFELVKLPTNRFAGNPKACMAFHPSAIGAAVARPHMRLADRGGKFDSVIELGAIWGFKIRKAAGIVRFLR